jgi:hypothetical protein
MISQLRKVMMSGLGAAMILSVPFAPALAGDNWGFSLGQGGVGFSFGDNHHRGRHGGYGGQYYGSGGYYNNYYQPVPYYQPQYNYYPSYAPYNPVIRRDVIDGGEYAPDGTFHSRTTVEDRSASYYSPGRNTAVTPPRTTTTRAYGPNGEWVNRERTSWIGADGRPHSTTVDQQTTQDVWGNTHTDTNVTLKRMQTSEPPNTQGEAPVSAQNYAEQQPENK